MKPLWLLACVLSSNSIIAQVITTKLVPVTIAEQQTLQLSAVAEGSDNSRTRATVKIDLPSETRSLYYSFSTTPVEIGINDLHLTSQLQTLFEDSSLKANGQAKQVKVPWGSTAIDFFLFDQKNADAFINNSEQLASALPEGTLRKQLQGVIDIGSSDTKTIYLALSNLDSLEAVNVTLEVVAIVEQIQGFPEEQSEAEYLGNLAWRAFEEGDYEKCITLNKNSIKTYDMLGFVRFNLALCYLMMGRNNEAALAYDQAVAVTSKTFMPKEIMDIAIEDLKKYLTQVPSPDDAQKILDKLIEEVKHFRQEQ